VAVVGREVAALRKLKGVLQIVHMDLQCVVKVDIMAIIYFLLYLYMLSRT